MARAKPVTVRNARFQQWETLLRNRTKRHRSGSFLVQGVRPITLAVEHGWRVEAMLFEADRRLSPWANRMLEAAGGAEQFALAASLMAELGGKDDPPELIAQVAMSETGLPDLRVSSSWLGVVFDRPSSPGNLGSLVRSADALGADAVIVTGRNPADVYDPQAVRATTGSLFAIPVVTAESAHEVADWVRRAPLPTPGIQLIGTDESGPRDVADQSLLAATLLVIGNETAGMSRAWRDLVDASVRIPMRAAAASSLNAAAAASIALYEVARQRAAEN